MALASTGGATGRGEGYLCVAHELPAAQSDPETFPPTPTSSVAELDESPYSRAQEVSLSCLQLFETPGLMPPPVALGNPSEGLVSTGH